VHVAPACAGSGEGSDHFGSIVRSLSLHLCKRQFPELELVTRQQLYHRAKAQETISLQNPYIIIELDNGPCFPRRRGRLFFF
jgi:hypothetical protein